MLSTPRSQIVAVSGFYLLLASMFATINLDTDEFAFIREPYELLGGDYTRGYVRQGNYEQALETSAKSYFFYWNYRPIFSPVIEERHKSLFAQEESEFGYQKPKSVTKGTPSLDALEKYQARLIVPEPDRFYSHGAGKPLLPALLTIPQLGLISLVSSNAELLTLQFSRNYHPLFVLTRAIQILAGLATVLLVYLIVSQQQGPALAALGAAICALFPLSVQYFPNLHHDSIMVPFLLASVHFLLKRRFIVAGLLYGLALASKNVAIFLVPVIAVYCLWKAVDAYKQDGFAGVLSRYNYRIKELAAFGLVSVAVLSLFANPVSYVTEIVTPFVERPFDPRGENVSDFSLASTLRFDSDLDDTSIIPPVLRFIRSFFGLTSAFIFFVVIALFACLQRPLNDVSKIAFIMLFMIMPFGLVYGYGLGYRQLMFVPFFSLLCTSIMTKKQMLVLLAVIGPITVLYCIDPISMSRMHTSLDHYTLVESIPTWFSQ